MANTQLPDDIVRKFLDCSELLPLDEPLDDLNFNGLSPDDGPSEYLARCIKQVRQEFRGCYENVS